MLPTSNPCLKWHKIKTCSSMQTNGQACVSFEDDIKDTHLGVRPRVDHPEREEAHHGSAHNTE